MTCILFIYFSLPRSPIHESELLEIDESALSVSGIFQPEPEFNQVKMHAHNQIILAQVLTSEKEKVRQNSVKWIESFFLISTSTFF